MVNIIVDEKNPVYDSRDNSNAIIHTESNTLIRGGANTIIPENVTIIDIDAFSGCTDLTSITIPDSVTIIWDSAFSGCTNLTSITIPKSVTKIYEYAFSDCTSLTSINYRGTEENWNAIYKVSDWDNNTPSNKIINYNYVG